MISADSMKRRSGPMRGAVQMLAKAVLLGLGDLTELRRSV